MTNQERLQQSAIEYLRKIGILDNDKNSFIIKFDDGRVCDVVDLLSEFRPEEWRDAKAVLPETDCLVYIGHEYGECSGKFIIDGGKGYFEYINPANGKWTPFPIPVQFWQPYYLNE